MSAEGAQSTMEPVDRAVLDHLWPHSDLAEWEELEEHGLPLFVSGDGSTLTDSHGRRYIDGIAGLYLVNVGHGRAEIAEAIARQASTLAYTASATSTNPAALELARTVASLTPGDLDRVFFCSGGSEAVESGVKIAKQAQALRGFPRRYKVIARRGSYHGMTFGGMSLTTGPPERYFGPFMPGVSKVPSPNRYRNDFGLDGEAGDLMCARFVEQEIVAQGADSVAAVIGEPISISNGTHLPAPGYWQELRRICDRHGVLLIMDEVITGYGRTGAMFAAEHYGVVPDIMLMAKGMSSGYAPIGAVAVREKVFEPFMRRGNALVHLLTFGGNAVSAAAAGKNIEILQREQLVARSAELGPVLFELAMGLQAHPTVGDVRGGLGLLCGIELVRSKERRAAWGSKHPFVKTLGRRLQEKGLFTRVLDVIHLSPPLVIRREEIERMVAIIDEALTEVEAEFAAEIEA